MFKVLPRLILIQFKTFYRQMDVIFWAILFPLALFIILGFAFNAKKDYQSNIGLVINPQAKIILEKLSTKNNYLNQEIKFNISEYQNKDEAINDLKKGKITLFINNTAETAYFFDPQNSAAQKDYAIIQNLVSPEKAKSAVTILKAKGTRYIDFFLPGLLAFNIMSGCLWGIGWGLIEIRMKKYLKRLTATPMSRSIFLLSQIITRLVISALEVSVLIIFAHFIFDITVSGNILALVYLFILGNFTFAAIGILIGSRTANSITGNGLLNAVLMPMMLTSGIFFSYHNFPKAIIPVIKFLPLTILADLIRMVFNEGAGFHVIFLPSLILALIAGFCFTIGVKIFKWY